MGRDNIKEQARKAIKTAKWAEENDEQGLLELQRERLQEIDEELPEGVTAGDVAA